MKQEVIAFRKNIPANSIDTIKERIKADGFIEMVTIRFYAGIERSLHVRPYVIRKGTRAQEDLFTYPTGTDGFITGEDDTMSFDVSLVVNYDDELEVWAKNVSGYNYPVVCDISITYESGAK